MNYERRQGTTSSFTAQSLEPPAKLLMFRTMMLAVVSGHTKEHSNKNNNTAIVHQAHASRVSDLDSKP